MSKILRIALAIAFIVVFYTGELVGILFDYQGINVVPSTIRHLCRECSQRVLDFTRGPPAQSSVLGPLPQGMFPSDIPGRLLHFCVNEKLVSPQP